MAQPDEERVAEDIAEHMAAALELRVHNWRRLDQGWLNVKWSMETDRGPVFVKWYHPDRYKLHKPEKRADVERSLELQHWLHKSGAACPGVMSGEGRFIQDTESGFRYAALEWVEGRSPSAGTIKAGHMMELGRAAGTMHRLLKSVPAAEPKWKPDRNVCITDLQKNLQQARDDRNEYMVDLLEQAIRNVSSIDFDWLSPSPVGWLHWDLWADNILLNETGVAGIVDFDRMAVAYPEIDVARAVISGALDGDGMRTDALRAFMEGYRERHAASDEALLRGMKLLYVIETVWWLRSELAKDRGVPVRFAQELEWLTRHWDLLPEIVL